jgi:hypothetical protein
VDAQGTSDYAFQLSSQAQMGRGAKPAFLDHRTISLIWKYILRVVMLGSVRRECSMQLKWRNCWERAAERFTFGTKTEYSAATSTTMRERIFMSGRGRTRLLKILTAGTAMGNHHD